MRNASFAKQLRKLRRQLGITQEEMGNRWGVSRERINYYENQEQLPASRLLVQLNMKFDVNCFEWLQPTSKVQKPPHYEVQITHNTNAILPTGTKQIA